MSAAQPLNYAGRCERYARQRGWAYDPKRLSIGHLTPRQRRRALHKELHQSPGYSRRTIDLPWDPRFAAYGDGDVIPFIAYDDGSYDDPHDLGYCVTPGCNCCGDD